MQFLKECAAELDAGAETETVMARVRERYTTPRCLNVKTCLIRNLCTPTREYIERRDTMLAGIASGHLAKRVRAALIRSGDADLKHAADSSDEAASSVTTEDVSAQARDLLRQLPPRLPSNVRALRITRDETKQCKRLAAKAEVDKNRKLRRVDARAMLARARADIARENSSFWELVMALLLLTGRRTCELLNGSSVFEDVGEEYRMRFGGQAKRRGDDDAYIVPVLAPVEQILRALTRLRSEQGFVVMGNRETSVRYQSSLRVALLADPLWKACKCVHGLRGVYVCASQRLFDWQDASPAFVAMHIIGHRGLKESLVYTPFHLGDDFHLEPRLGQGYLPDEALEGAD